MPAVGILKKPPHPNPPSLTERTKPPRPPKPKRGIPVTPLRSVGDRNHDVHFVDEDEPTTEESYDYKDIDFASDIFDWRIPPPRPKPPRLQQNGIAHRVSDDVPSIVHATPAVAYDTQKLAMEQRLDSNIDQVTENEQDSKTEDAEENASAVKLAKFMVDHEGKELTLEDVRQLEMLLDEAEGVQREPEMDHERNEEFGEEDQGCTENGENHSGEKLNRTEKITFVRFRDENGLDANSGEMRGEIPDEEMTDGQVARHADYGIVEFFHDHGKKNDTSREEDSGTYEPVGRQDLRFVRPDMSGYKPPEPSTNVGDPFSWRRRGKRRHYGYEPLSNGCEQIPALDKIIDGCQEVEEMIKLRDLTPPGMLLDSLGRKKRVRKAWVPSPPPRPPPPIPPKLRTSSPLPPIPKRPEFMNGEQMEMEQGEHAEFESEMDLEMQLELEKQILPDNIIHDNIPSEMELQDGGIVAEDISKLNGFSSGNEIQEHIINEIIVPTRAESYQTGTNVETAGSLMADFTVLSSMEPAICQTDVAQKDGPAIKDDVRDGPKEHGIEEGEVRVAPKRVSRRDKPPHGRPIRPERRKRVASAEPPLTAFGLEQEEIQKLERVTLPRMKPKRSASFHTAEEIRRRIDVQAQNYLRTPRRKDILSCTYMSASPSASATLSYGTLRRNHHRPLTPVYSHVNKELMRRKEAGVQTNGGADGQDDVESLPPIPPPKLQDEDLGLEHDEDDAMDSVIADGAPGFATSIPEDSEVPSEFLSYKETMVDGSEAVPRVQQLECAGVENSSKAMEPCMEDSKVPLEFLALSKTDGKAVENNSNTKSEVLKSGGEDSKSKATLEGSGGDNQLTSSNGRPLPPPPAPPRHRGSKVSPSAKAFTVDSPIVICGILPTGEEAMAASKLGVLPDLKVLRLSVVQLEASMLRVGQIETDHLIARKIDSQEVSRTPTPTTQVQLHNDNLNNPSISDSNRSTERSESDGTNRLTPDSSRLNRNVSEFEPAPVSDVVGVPKASLLANVVAPSRIRCASPVEEFNVWDPECTQDRPECASPTNTVTSTTSGSASYVTCDETLHGDSDVTTDGLDAGSVDGDFGFGLDEDFDDGDGGGTGCATPTEMNVTVGGDVPLMLISDPSHPFLSGATPIFAPPKSYPLASSSPISPPHSPSPMDTDMDENCNAFGGNDAEPGGTVKPEDGGDVKDSKGQFGSASDSPTVFRENGETRQIEVPPLAVTKKLLEAKMNGGNDSIGIQKSSSSPSISPAKLSEKYKAPNYAASFRRTKSIPKRPASGQFYVDIKPSENDVPNPKPPPPPPAQSKPNVGRRLAYHNGEGSLKVSGTGHCKQLSELPSHSKEQNGKKEFQNAENSEPEIPQNTTDVILTDAKHEESNAECNAETEHNESGVKRDKAFLVAQEMMTSERAFVDILKLLNVDFRNAVKDTDIQESHLNQILNFLPQLQQLNEVLLKDMEERLEKWDEIGRISDVIVRIGPFLKLYASYIKSFSGLSDALSEACKKFPLFSEAIKSFENSDRCQKLSINQHMLKPVQRIPQYRLLLQDYLKCLQESSLDYQSTQEALVIVSEVADHANETIKQAENFEKLIEIQNRLYGGFTALTPGRLFIKEGELQKLCRKGMQIRRFFLVSIPTQEDYRNEFSIISVSRSFTLSASSPEERDEWVECLNQAIEKMSTRIGTFISAKIQKVGTVRSELMKDEPLGKKAPVWIPDSRVTLCQLCTREFSLTFRRHHCRACGKVVCSICSANQAPLCYQNYEPMRVCDICYTILKEDFDQQLTNKSNDSEDSPTSKNGLNLPTLESIRSQFKKLNTGVSNIKKPDLSKVLREVGASDADSSMRGYLHFRIKKGWKKQWFVIKDKVLYSYKASEDIAALSSTPLLGFTVQTYSKDQEGCPAQLCFGLSHVGHPLKLFYADNLKLAEMWLKAMIEATIL